MPISEELLAAFVDGELDNEARTAVERAIAADAQLAQRVARQRKLRGELRAAFDGALQEPIPAQLLRVVSAVQDRSKPADVIDLAFARAARVSADAQPRSSLRQWKTAIAASVIVAVVAGFLVQRFGSGESSAEYRDGVLLARGALAAALTNQLASAAAPGTAAAAGAHVGLSFRSNSGNFCRTFVVNERQSVAGLACRQGGVWHVAMLLSVDSPSGSTTASPRYGMAASALPPALAEAVTERIAGEPLDAGAEAAARQRGWH